MRIRIGRKRQLIGHIFRPFNWAVLLVAATILSGFAIGQSAPVGDAEIADATTVPVTKVLQNSDWLSDKAWQRRQLKKLRRTSTTWADDARQDTSSGSKRRPHRQKSSAVGSYGNYRTVCVRLCDGYYFPVSFSTSKDRFKDDEQACQSRCSGGARLFYYNNYDGSPETMTDLEGRTYRSLKTAYLYRTIYKPSCQCRAAPWSDQAKQRHALYRTKKWQKNARRLARKEHRKGLRVARASSRKARFASGRTQPTRASKKKSLATANSGPSSIPTGRMSLGGRITGVAPKPRVRSTPRAVSRSKKKWRRSVLFGVGNDN